MCAWDATGVVGVIVASALLILVLGMVTFAIVMAWRS